MKEIIHFSHANGFPAGSYRTLFDHLKDDFEIGYIDRLGHQPHLPVGDNWPNLESELIHYMATTYDRPVFAVGHSLGGILSLMVAIKRPDLVKGIIMLDSPLLTRFEAGAVQLIKRVGMMDRVTPAGRTLGRKETWDSRAEAHEYFQDKSLFKKFDPRCFHDYIEAGIHHDNGIHKLFFDPKTEIKIYRTIPHNISNAAPIKVPAAVVGGLESDVFKKHHAVKMRMSHNMKVKWLPGSHMFPMEHPELTVQTIKTLIAGMQKKLSKKSA